MRDPLRHHTQDPTPFGSDRFGQLAESFARAFGTPRFIITQTVIIILWVIVNGLWLTAGVHWDPYPFILLNLVFSTQAAYAAPLILLAQTRQAERDKIVTEADAKHREELAQHHQRSIEANTRLTEQILLLIQDLGASRG